MPKFTVTFQDAPEVAALRRDPARRAAHIAFVRGEAGLQIGGVLAMRPMQDFPGAIWTVEAASRGDVMRLLQRDPYFVAGLRHPDIREEGGQSAVSGLVF